MRRAGFWELEKVGEGSKKQWAAQEDNRSRLTMPTYAHAEEDDFGNQASRADKARFDGEGVTCSSCTQLERALGGWQRDRGVVWHW